MILNHVVWSNWTLLQSEIKILKSPQIRKGQATYLYKVTSKFIVLNSKFYV